MPAVPTRIVIEIPAEEQVRLHKQLRRARWGGWLSLHILLLPAQKRSPTDIACWLFCSRSTVYSVAAAWRQGRRPWQEQDACSSLLPAFLTPMRQRILKALLQQAPSVFGWCRRRWSCATLALSLPPSLGSVSEETVRRWLHALGWRWKRARPAAKDNDPERASKLARIRLLWESLQPRQALLFADELDLHLLPKMGCQWMPAGTQVEVMTPGKNEKRYLAGAWDVRTGKVEHVIWYRKQAGLFVDLLQKLESSYPAQRYDQVFVVADNCKIHKADCVQRWLCKHARVQLVFQPKYCPKSNPIERVFGEVHDKVTRNHKRKQMWRLVADVQRHLRENGPWHYQRSQIYDAPEVTAAIRRGQQRLPSAA